MLTTLSITSMNQGKIAPRYDIEPRSVEKAACRMEIAPWQVRQSALVVRTRLLTWFGRRNIGHQSPAPKVASAGR